MSTFSGFIQEIPKISVDRFDGINLKSEVFFLSHFHADHMVGLRKPDFHAVLRKRDSAYVYCTELTALFLTQNHLQGLGDKIKILPMNKEHVINIDDVHGFLSVTALPAGHCPGSAMFLFCYKGLNYLYTGDYRMTKDNIVQLRSLMEPNGTFKSIETLYLDTTFFLPCYSYLPSREESTLELIKLCRSWLDKGDDYMVDLRTPATVGVEYVLIALSKEFGQTFHVSDSAYEKYSRIPELSSAVSKDPNSKLHACVSGHLRNGKSLFLKSHTNMKENNILSVKLCSLHATNFSKDKNLVSYAPKQRLYRVVYSSHSSHCELLEMIETLLPKRIEACVLPNNYTSEMVVNTLQRSDRQILRSDSDDLSVLQFSTYEEVAYSGCDSDINDEDKNPTPEVKGTGALLTFSKYNVNESSDEEECFAESDEDELPPFRWDCYYDASKHVVFQKRHRKNSNSNRSLRRKVPDTAADNLNV